MTFDQPWVLMALLAVPVLLAAYVWQLHRRRRTAVRYSNVALVRTAAGPVRRWRRHVPIGLVLASLALLGFASARPLVKAEVPVSNSTILLALDVSGSMCATDVAPNRLTAAQAAVRSFIETQDPDTKIGLVLFSGFAQLSVPPTTDKQDLLDTIDGVTTGRGTTIGAAILRSIDAIAELDPSVAPSDPTDGDNGLGDPPSGLPTPTPSGDTTDAPAPEKRDQGDYAPEIIVLLTDGANTRGVTPQEAAEQAAARGVRVYAIGFGTKNPTQMVCSREQLGGLPQRFNGFGNRIGGAGGGRNYLVVDEEALKTVATTTGGEYFAATDANQLTSVLTDLPEVVVRQEQDVDISAGFAALAAVLLLLGLGMSIRWSTLT